MRCAYLPGQYLALASEDVIVAVPLPGDFACVPMDGPGWGLIGLGERLYVPKAARAMSRYRHAYVYVGGGMVVQAEPGGAVLALRHDPQALWSTGKIPLTQEQRDSICAAARGYVGVDYSFLDYWAMAAHRQHLPMPGLREYIESTHHQICSQLVDRCYFDAGVHLFADGRWPGYVTPACLAARLEGLEKLSGTRAA